MNTTRKNTKLLKMNLNYEFEPLGGSSRDGYNDPLKTMFGKKLQDNLAREAIQNSLDAVDDRSRPVYVKFSLKKWSKKEIPQVDHLTEIFKACSQDESSGAHFKNSEKVINSKNIPVLIISDFNTTGLTGSNDDIKGKFYNFFKCVGGNNKQSGDAGSYGYGKAAYISGSCIDTFFAVSYFKSKKTIDCLFMGSIRVVSHMIRNVMKRGIGSFGLQNQIPVRDKKFIPNQFLIRDDQPGTDIFVIGLRNPENCLEQIEKAVLKHFWLAIYEGKLVVQVEDLKIDKKNLIEKMHEAFKDVQTTLGWKTENPIPYIDAYLNGEKKEIILPTLGKVRLYLKIQKDPLMATSHVACFRKNLMRIQIKKFQSIVPFSGVFLCPEEPGNSILRKMEPPNHMAWDKDEVHAKDENDRPLPECASADKEYKGFIRDEINKLWIINPKATLKIDNLDKFISLPEENELQREITNGEGDIKEDEAETGDMNSRKASISLAVFRKEPKKGASVPGTDENGLLDVDGEGPGKFEPPHSNEQGPSKPDEKGDKGETGGGDTSAKTLNHLSRYMVYSKDGKNLHQLIVRSALANKAVRLKIQESGDEDVNPIEVISVSPQGKIEKNGQISGLTTNNKGIFVINLEIKNKVKPSIRTTLYEV